MRRVGQRRRDAACVPEQESAAVALDESSMKINGSMAPMTLTSVRHGLCFSSRPLRRLASALDSTSMRLAARDGIEGETGLRGSGAAGEGLRNNSPIGRRSIRFALIKLAKASGLSTPRSLRELGAATRRR